MWSKTFNPNRIIDKIENRDKQKKMAIERTPEEQKERFKELDAFFDDWEEKEKTGELTLKERIV